MPENIEQITYTSHPNDNTREVYEFIGNQPDCPICGGDGEYESDGPKACLPCCSRLIFFIDSHGDRVGADWGDTIYKDEDGLTLVQRHLYG